MPMPIADMLRRMAVRLTRPEDRVRPNRRTSVTALDIEHGRLHVVQAVIRGGQTRITRHAFAELDSSHALDPADPAALGEAVGRALGKLEIRPGPVVMGVPRAHAIMRALHLPPAERSSEIAAMVYFQVNRDLPFRLDDALLDFKVLSQAKGAAAESGRVSANLVAKESNPSAPGSTQVLAAVVRRKTVEHHQALARAAGLKLTALGLRSLAATRAIEFCHPGSSEDGVALVSLDDGEVIFDVMERGALVFSRIGTLPPTPEPSGAPPSDPGPSLIEAVMLEVVRSLHSYEHTEGHGRVTRFFVAGTRGTETGVAQALARRFGIPAQGMDPIAALGDAGGDPEHAAGAVPALGLALGALDPEGFSFDFLNPKRPPIPRDNRKALRLAAVAGALAVLLTVAGLRAHWIRQREAERTDLRQQVTLTTKNLGAFRLVRSQARALNDWVASGRNWLDHLTLLSALLPPSQELYVTAISTSPRNTINLAIKVRSGETVDRLSATLKSAGYDLRPPAITPARDPFGYRFQAGLELDVPARITNDLDHLTVESRPPPRPREERTVNRENRPPPPPRSEAKPEPRPAVEVTVPPPQSETNPEDRPRRGRRGGRGRGGQRGE